MGARIWVEDAEVADLEGAKASEGCRFVVAFPAVRTSDGEGPTGKGAMEHE
jgi:hypothetical protein